MKYLELKYSISKARDTYGYNVVTLIDQDKKYKARGGGYDMIGTVFAQWLWDNYKDLIIATILPKAKDFYGFSSWEIIGEGKRHSIDGACGLDWMIKIAREIGLEINRDYRKNLKGFFIQEKATV